ncbi:P-loop NTPase [Alteromonas gracilis]
MVGDRTGVLLAGGGAPWEGRALEVLERAGLVVLKRCVDVSDLLAGAARGQAAVAVVAADLRGLDADAVVRLLRDDVRVVSVGDEDLGRLGVVGRVDADDLEALPEAVRGAAVREVVADPLESDDVPVVEPLGERARVVAVWGPTGGPGRTTVAVGLAARLGTPSRPAVLADLDPYGGSVAQHLGVLDEVSGVLAAARLVNNGELDDRTFAGCRRQVADAVQVLTGLPRADRWVEVRDGVVEQIVDLAAHVGPTVLDVGFCLEHDDAGFGPGRNAMTLDALAAADEIVVVGSADAVGLARLARALLELGEAVPVAALRVVVNRMRDSLGWSHADVTGMVEGFARPLGVHVLPDDREAVDRAMLAGTPVLEDSPLARGLGDLASAMAPGARAAVVRRGLRARLRR